MPGSSDIDKFREQEEVLKSYSRLKLQYLQYFGCNDPKFSFIVPSEADSLIFSGRRGGF